MLLHLKRILKRIFRKFETEIITEKKPEYFTYKFHKKTQLLKDSDLKKYALEIIENGYTVVENSVNLDLIDKAVTEFYNWKFKNAGKMPNDFFKIDGRLNRIIDIHTKLSSFKDLFSTNKALLVQDYLFSQETVLYSSLFFEIGSTQTIHRDIPLFWNDPAFMYFGTWLALEDTDSSNGPLIVIPGSHKLPLFSREKFAKELKISISDIQPIHQELWDKYQNKIIEECQKAGLHKKEVHVKKGDTIIWHPLLAHGGKDILDVDRTRLSYVVHTTPKNISVHHMDVFFNEHKKVSKELFWDYTYHNDRLIKNSSLTINHNNDFDYSIFD